MKKPWRKVLYEKKLHEEYGDDYIDPIKFLDTLQSTENSVEEDNNKITIESNGFLKYKLLIQLMSQCTVIVMQYGIAIFFLAIYKRLNKYQHLNYQYRHNIPMQSIINSTEYMDVYNHSIVENNFIANSKMIPDVHIDRQQIIWLFKHVLILIILELFVHIYIRACTNQKVEHMMMPDPGNVHSSTRSIMSNGQSTNLIQQHFINEKLSLDTIKSKNGTMDDFDTISNANDPYDRTSDMNKSENLTIYNKHVDQVVPKSEKSINNSFTQMLHKAIMYIIYSYLVSPILHALTSSFSSDTIYACAALGTCVHLVCFDYDYIFLEHNPSGNNYKDKQHIVGDKQQVDSIDTNNRNVFNNEFYSITHNVTSSLSFNASMVTTVLLASRLNYLPTVFLFIMLAVLLFKIIPHTIKLIYMQSKTVHLLITISVIWYTISMLLMDSKILCIVYVSILSCIWVLAPIGFHYLYNLNGLIKIDRKGPWDIAVI